jgi:hypothetical protein
MSENGGSVARDYSPRFRLVPAIDRSTASSDTSEAVVPTAVTIAANVAAQLHDFRDHDTLWTDSVRSPSRRPRGFPVQRGGRRGRSRNADRQYPSLRRSTKTAEPRRDYARKPIRPQHWSWSGEQRRYGATVPPQSLFCKPVPPTYNCRDQRRAAGRNPDSDGHSLSIGILVTRPWM